MRKNSKTHSAKKQYKLAAVVHAETSTGVLQPLDDIAKLVRASGALLLVDAVTSLGGAPVRVDELGIDACYSGTQKCLSCSAGLIARNLQRAGPSKSCASAKPKSKAGISTSR